jgi:hypothetical protein
MTKLLAAGSNLRSALGVAAVLLAVVAGPLLFLRFGGQPTGWVVGDASVIVGPATFTVACAGSQPGDVLRSAIDFKPDIQVFVRFLLAGHCPTDAAETPAAGDDNPNPYNGMSRWYGDDLISNAFQYYVEQVNIGYQDSVTDFAPSFVRALSKYGAVRFLYWALLYAVTVIVTAFFANVGTTISKKVFGSDS